MFEKMSFIPGMAINALKTRQSAVLTNMRIDAV